MTSPVADYVTQAQQRAALADRSAGTYALVVRGLERGLRDDEIRALATRDDASVEKYGDRLPSEVDRILRKQRPQHGHVGSTCDEAACPSGTKVRSASAKAPEIVTPIDWDEFWSADRRRPRYVLEPLLPEGRTTTVFSPPKLGKSLLGLEIAAGVATGATMWGQALEPRDVLYLDQEMTGLDLMERLTDLGYKRGDDLRRLHYFLQEPWLPADTAAGGSQLLRELARTGAELLILDTQSKMLDGDENDAGTMTRFFRYTLGPLKRRGVTVLIFDHAGRDVAKGARGSSQKPADVDAVWRLSSRSATGLTLTRTHNRTRHGDGVLYLERDEDPLRHVLTSADGRSEEVINTCLERIRKLEIDPGTSARDVAKQLRGEGKGYRDETLREAVRRYRTESSRT